MHNTTKSFVLQVLRNDPSATADEHSAIIRALDPSTGDVGADEWLTRKEAAKYLRLGLTQFWQLVRTARKDRNSDLLPVRVHDRGRPLWSKQALRRYMNVRAELALTR